MADGSQGWHLRGYAVFAAMGLVAVGAAPLAMAQPVVQALPDPAAATLSDALLDLSRNPQSLEALLTAGRSSLTLGQMEAAEGFFRRAAVVAPEDGRVQAGLAAIALRRQQPADALRLFDQAEGAGADMVPYAAEQGLAYDLVGDNANAQRVYQRALADGDDAEMSRRLAISQAIAGDKAAAEATLLPMLEQGDLAAFRSRAFVLAILGEEEEAVSIAQTLLPQEASSRLAPYLRYMPRLTRAQQAAAANLGIFPPAGEIGRDRPAVSAYAAPAGRAPTQPAEPDDRLAPQGPALGSSVGELPANQVGPANPPEQGQVEAGAAPAAELAGVSAQQDTTASPAPASPAPMPVPATAQGPAAPGPAPTPAPAPRENLASAFADFTAQPVQAVNGAVDISSFEPVREVAAPEPPPPPANPSRQWVQIATGRDVSAFAFDWRRIRRRADGLLDDAQPHVASWGETNRLLVGPFESAEAADELVNGLKQAGADSFRFTSESGEKVDPLD